MSIEYRAMLRQKMKFQSGTKLAAGSIVYVEETPHGWVGKHYPRDDTTSGLVFMLEPEDFSLFEVADTFVQEIVVVPESELDEESIQREELARRRIERKIEQHREEADRLEAFLAGRERYE